MSKSIVVIGSLNMDLVLHVPRAPVGGETLVGQSFATVPGGKGANQAVACARLGGRVSMVGRVGNDEFGQQLRAGIASDGVDVDHVSVDPSTSTGVALIMVDASAQNRIVIVAGANGTLSNDHVDAAAQMINGAALVVVQLETPLAVVEHAINCAGRANVPVLLNPAPARILPLSVLSQVDYLVPNESEAAVLSGIDVIDMPGAIKAAGLLLGRGPKHVLMTLGARGVLIADAKGERVIAAPHVAAVDSTAAGDTFIGAFAVSIVAGLSVDAAVEFAVNAAALSVCRHGAQTSIPTRRDVEQFAAQNR